MSESKVRLLGNFLSIPLITNSDKAYGEIDLGDFQTQDGKMYHFKGVVDERGRYVKIDE